MIGIDTPLLHYYMTNVLLVWALDSFVVIFYFELKSNVCNLHDSILVCNLSFFI